jgi:predicted phage terminase large subunit-like protein
MAREIDLELVRQEAKKELARRYFYDYCQLRFPQLYKDDRKFLKTLCESIQAFTEQNEKRFLIINLPPRFLKSLTATNLVEWLFGQDTALKVMTGSYNETLSGSFARKVRDTIDQQPSKGVEVYNNLFPKTKIKYGQASKSLWALEGSSQDNYLATSPTGTATGFGADYILLDDIIKNAEEAYNRLVLEKHWDWFTNTMLSRTEGNDWKVIAIMTRWAKDDLAGRIIEHYGDLVEVVQFKAVQVDGSMLCDEILNKADYLIKTQEMAREIVEANYNQEPIDVQGRLYESFMTYETLPKGAKDAIRRNYTDTADKGTDFLCSVCYLEFESDVYILDVVMSDEAMEITEPMVANMLDRNDVNEAEVESNSGGRGFGRNIERLLKESKNLKCVITEKTQTSNKEARILSSSAWVQKRVYMPHNWIQRFPEFAKQLLAYQRKGKNPHDDAPDVLAGIYEKVANEKQVDYSWETY